MNRIPLIFCFFLLVGSSVQAQLYRAQPRPSRDIENPEKLVKPKEAERTMAQFSKCLLRKPWRKTAAMNYLALPNGDPEQGKRGLALTSSGCVPSGTSQMRFQSRMFRNSIFSALYAKYFRKEEPKNLVTKPPLDFKLEFNEVRAPVSKLELAVRNFGDCVSRRNADEVHSLLLTPIHSNKEKESISAIMPDLSACLTDGVQLKFSRTVIRGILAEAMYKRKRCIN